MKKQNSPSTNHRDQDVNTRAQRIGRRAFLAHSARALAGMTVTAVFARSAFAADSSLLQATVGNDNARLLAAACERIIPTTDTPGAVTAGVPQYIAEVLKQIYLEAETQRFLSDLSRFGTSVESETGALFPTLSDAQQDEQLQRLADSPVTADSDFFNELRQLTVYGYYTSELGAQSETELAHSMTPWNGDIALSEVGKVWTR